MTNHLFTAALLATLLAACDRTPQPGQAKRDTATTAPELGRNPKAPLPSPEGRPRRPDVTIPQRDVAPVDAKVVAVRLSDQGDTEKQTLGMPTSQFGPKDTIFAEIETTGTASGYTIYAKWAAPDGTVLSDYGMKVNEAGLKRTVISLSKPDGWQSGTNTLEIAINGEKQQVATFRVP
jgi:hypothetical protein